MKIKDLLETYKNLFTDSEKEKFADVVWNMIQRAYDPIGGIKGTGFRSKEDMISNIPMWKLVKRGEKIIAIAMYKDKDGRKRVAVATDGSEEGKKELARIYKDDFDRAYFEVSGPSLAFMVKSVGIQFVSKYAKLPSEAESILSESVYSPTDEALMARFPELRKFMYDRTIGDHRHTKVMLGTTGKKIIIKD